MRHEVATRRVLYEIPGMHAVQVSDAEFAGADGRPLPMRTYGCMDGQRPVVMVLAGLPDARFAEHVGCRFMDMEWTISMARLLAASGFAAITHSNRDAQEDAFALIEHVQQTTRRVGIWSTSANGPVALNAAARVSCAVLNNPMVKDFCPNTPLFIVRAGQDENAG